MKNHKALLYNLLLTLVDEWGASEVHTALSRVASEPNLCRTRTIASEKLQTRAKSRPSGKLLAREQVTRAQLPKQQEAALQRLAVRFDNKEFLPSAGDVREFMVMMGETPPGAIKDRSTAFRIILKVLAKMPPEKLADLANGSRHSGPSRLETLSEAISKAGTSLSRFRDSEH